MLTEILDEKTARTLSPQEHRVFDTLLERTDTPKEVSHYPEFAKYLLTHVAPVDVLGMIFNVSTTEYDDDHMHYVVAPVGEAWRLLVDTEVFAQYPLTDSLAAHLLGDGERYALDMTLLKTALI